MEIQRKLEGGERKKERKTSAVNCLSESTAVCKNESKSPWSVIEFMFFHALETPSAP